MKYRNSIEMDQPLKRVPDDEVIKELIKPRNGPFCIEFMCEKAFKEKSKDHLPIWYVMVDNARTIEDLVVCFISEIRDGERGKCPICKERAISFTFLVGEEPDAIQWKLTDEDYDLIIVRGRLAKKGM